MGAPDGARFFGWESPIGEKSFKIYTESNKISALRAERKCKPNRVSSESIVSLLKHCRVAFEVDMYQSNQARMNC